MKAWTYESSPVNGLYWYYQDTAIIAVEYDDGRMEWQRVDTGEVFTAINPPIPTHKGKLLDPQYYPPWYPDFDAYSVDEGL